MPPGRSAIDPARQVRGRSRGDEFPLGAAITHLPSGPCLPEPGTRDELCLRPATLGEGAGVTQDVVELGQLPGGT